MEGEKTRGSILLCLRSRDMVNTPANGYNSSGRFMLLDPIEAEANEILTLRLISAIIPNSWHNLSSSLANNTLSITEKRISDSVELSYSVTIPDGSYSINELNDEIKSLLDTKSASNGYSLTYTFSYNEINNLDTITSSDYTAYNTTFKFSEGGCRRFLGFTSENKTINSAAGIISDRSVDVTDTYNSIYIRLPNLSNQKVYESFTSQNSNIIAQIPLTLSRNSFISYEPNHPFEMEIKNTTISNIFTLITYQNERQEVDFQNNDWEINIEVGFRRTSSNRLRNRHKHQQAFNALKMPNIRRKFDTFIDRYNDDMEKIAELSELLKNK